MAFKVQVTYKNEEGESVSEREYSILEYSDMIKTDLFRVITEVEDVIYLSLDGKSKDEWSPSVLRSFNKIKHKLLDKAGEVSRLPNTLRHYETPEEADLSQWIASIFRQPNQ